LCNVPSAINKGGIDGSIVRMHSPHDCVARTRREKAPVALMRSRSVFTAGGDEMTLRVTTYSTKSTPDSKRPIMDTMNTLPETGCGAFHTMPSSIMDPPAVRAPGAHEHGRWWWSWYEHVDRPRECTQASGLACKQCSRVRHGSHRSSGSARSWRAN